MSIITVLIVCLVVGVALYLLGLAPIDETVKRIILGSHDSVSGDLCDSVHFSHIWIFNWATTDEALIAWAAMQLATA